MAGEAACEFARELMKSEIAMGYKVVVNWKQCKEVKNKLCLS